jgi:hypothetical protein
MSNQSSYGALLGFYGKLFPLSGFVQGSGQRFGVFVSFDNEVAGVSTQALVWGSTDPLGGNTLSGNRLNVQTGPTVQFTQFGSAKGMSADQIRDIARERAITFLLDQLLALHPTVTFP